MDVLVAVMENVAFPFTRVIACTRKNFQHPVVNSPCPDRRYQFSLIFMLIEWIPRSHRLSPAPRKAFQYPVANFPSTQAVEWSR